MNIFAQLTIGDEIIKFNSLEELQKYYSFDQIKKLTIICGLRNIPKLPDGLQEFNCGCNKIRKIENLPDRLQRFHCSYNQISKIEKLPNGLQQFHCEYNQMNKIDNLPNKLQSLRVSGNYCLKKIKNIKDKKNLTVSSFECKMLDCRITNSVCNNFEDTQDMGLIIDENTIDIGRIPKIEYIIDIDEGMI